MQVKWMTAALFAILVMSGTGTSLAQQAIEKFRPLVEVSARRLLIGSRLLSRNGIVERPWKIRLVKPW